MVESVLAEQNMGQVLVEIPQKVNRSYHVDDSAFSEQLLDDLQPYESDRPAGIVPPRRSSLKEDGDAVLGIWSDREETADQIARRVRKNNRKVT